MCVLPLVLPLLVLSAMLLLSAAVTATCYPPSLAAGVQASAPAGKQFKWDGCLTGTNKLGVFGDRCGSSSEKFRCI